MMYLVYSLPGRRNNVEQFAMSKKLTDATPHNCQGNKNSPPQSNGFADTYDSKQDTIHLILEFVCCFVCTSYTAQFQIVYILENGAVLSIAEATESHPWGMLSVV